MTNPNSNNATPDWQSQFNSPESAPQHSSDPYSQNQPQSQFGQQQFASDPYAQQQPQQQFGQQQYSQPQFGQPQHSQSLAPMGGQYAMGTAQPQYAAYTQPKSRVAAALLAFFLGTLGIHNFYLGYTGRGIAQLILTIVGWMTVWLIIGGIVIIAVGIWVLVEFFMILIGSGSYARSADGVLLT